MRKIFAVVTAAIAAVFLCAQPASAQIDPYNPIVSTFRTVTIATQIFSALTARSIQSSNLPIGTTDLYTVPSGKKFVFFGVLGYNNSAGTIGYSLYTVISGTAYRLILASSMTTGAASNPTTTYVMEAGETLRIITATTAGMNLTVRGYEVADTYPIKSAKLTTVNIGDNLLYTSPNGAIPVDLNGNATLPTGILFNDSIGSTTFFTYQLPSGQVLSNAFKITAGLGTATGSSNQFRVSQLGAGDSIYINSTAAGPGIFAYVTVIECASSTACP